MLRHQNGASHRRERKAMELIDARNKFKPSYLADFIKKASDEINVDILDAKTSSSLIVTMVTKQKIVDFLLNEFDFDAYEDDATVILTSGECALSALVKDINYYRATTRRKTIFKNKFDELMEIEIETILTPEKKTSFHVMTVHLVEDEPVIEEFEGSKEDTVEWLNLQLIRNCKDIDSEGKPNLLISLTNEDPEFLTVNQLFTLGYISLK